MFYNLNLDDKSYREIEEDAVFQIPGECVDWTNYNQSDPGIMLIGLLSWLKEIQQYHISRLGGWKRQKYLKLLGVTMRHAVPARGFVSAEPLEGSPVSGCPLLMGTRFFAGDMAFETVKKEWPHPIKLMGAYLLCGETLERYVNIGNDLEKHMRLYPFGEQPEIGSCCCFVIDRAFRHKEQTVVYFNIRTDYGVTRNPIEEDFIPLAKLKWEYQSSDGWEELPVDFDMTYAFLQSGKIGFHLPHEMVKDEEYGAYKIRVTLVENDYDVAPLIQDVYFNVIEVRQQYSYCDYEDYCIKIPGPDDMLFIKSDMYLAKNGEAELYARQEEGFLPIPIIGREYAEDGDVIFSFARPDWAEEGSNMSCRLAVYEKEFWEKREFGIGNDFANQEYDLDISGIVYDEFEIMVCDRQDGRFHPYQRVEDFDHCMSGDAVYDLDLMENRLIFGNCENGMAPDGKIRLMRLKTSEGKSGNIKAGKIRECQNVPELLVEQKGMTYGGRDNETVEECYQRLCRKLKDVHRGVTYSDYEKLVKKTPGLLIQSSKVIPLEAGRADEQIQQENQISIVVQPVSYKTRNVQLSDKYRKNLEQMLQRRKMIGTTVKILNPEYVGISVFAEIVIQPHFTDAEEQIEEAVRAYLDEKTWEIGRAVSSSAIYGIIDILPCVWQVKSVSVGARGRGFRHLVNGDVQLSPNGLPYVDELDFRVFTAGGNEIF
ncbi:MAG: baseplate J/gp47 family protein [Lachnospiraceae bacterium]|nr:baseplate J/gp47 family protein [Lachnospiraceae bacterium]